MQDFLVVIYDKDNGNLIDFMIVTGNSEKSVCKRLKKEQWCKNQSYDLFSVNDVNKMKRLMRRD
jgi:hypothetical protein